jgi:hypothetical protein
LSFGGRGLAARLSGLASGLALAVRPAGSALGLQGQRRAEGASRAAGCGAPLRLEGPTRTMRGVQAGCLRTFARRSGYPARDDDPASSQRASLTVRYGGERGNGGAGRGPGRCAPAQEARARLPRHLRRESPSPWPLLRCTPRLVQRFTVHVPRILRESRPGPVGLARRRCTLDR